MRLQHLHLLRPVPYDVASRIQDAVVRRHIDHGLQQQRSPPPSSTSSSSSSSPSLSPPHPPPPPPPPPPPFLLTFQSRPTYTCGRREIAGISDARVAYLTAHGRAAAFRTSLRGGQTTFHGPGQVTAYLVCSLRRHGLTPRCYVRLLERAVIALCAHLGVPATTTADPGVWLARAAAPPDRPPEQEQEQEQEVDKEEDEEEEEEKKEKEKDGRRRSSGCDATPPLRATDSKICAVGVHMRRGVTSHGLGLNVHPDLGWFERIVACGLVGKRVTSLHEAGASGLGVRETAMLLADIVARELQGVHGIDAVDLAGAGVPYREVAPPKVEEGSVGGDVPLG